MEIYGNRKLKEAWGNLWKYQVITYNFHFPFFLMHVWFLIMGQVQHPDYESFGLWTFSPTTMVMPWCPNTKVPLLWHVVSLQPVHAWQACTLLLWHMCCPFPSDHYIPVANSSWLRSRYELPELMLQSSRFVYKECLSMRDHGILLNRKNTTRLDICH